MSKYTTEVRFICENFAGYDESQGFSSVDQIIAAALPKVFPFEVPLFDPAYKDVLCTKILRHYYTREIGSETVGLWQLRMQTKLDEILPYYNQLYRSELIKFNPLYDTDLQTTQAGQKDSDTQRQSEKTGMTQTSSEDSRTDSTRSDGTTVGTDHRAGTNAGESDSTAVNAQSSSTEKSDESSSSDQRENVSSASGTETGSRNQEDLYTDTPQGGLSGILDRDYLTNAREISGADSKTTKTGSTGLDSGTSQTSGSSSESGKTEGTQVTQGHEAGEFDEGSERTEVKTDTGTRESSGSTTQSGSSLENATGRDRFNSTESYVLHVAGKQSGASFSKMLQEFRETFLNIDMMIINDLAPLFMGLW